MEGHGSIFRIISGKCVRLRGEDVNVVIMIYSGPSIYLYNVRMMSCNNVIAAAEEPDGGRERPKMEEEFQHRIYRRKWQDGADGASIRDWSIAVMGGISDRGVKREARGAHHGARSRTWSKLHQIYDKEAKDMKIHKD